MPPLATKATIEEKTNTCTDRRHTTEDNNNFKKSFIHESTQTAKIETGKSRMGRNHWVTDICYNSNEL